MKISRVLVLLIISTIFIGSFGCNEMMDMTKPVTTPNPEEPNPPIVEVLEPETPEEPKPPEVETSEPEVDYYQIVIEARRRAIQRTRMSEQPGDERFFVLFEEETGVAYSYDIQTHLQKIVEEEKDVGPQENINFDMLLLEYAKLSLEFPEKTSDEIFDLFRESVRNNTLLFIVEKPKDSDVEDAPLPELLVGE